MEGDRRLSLFLPRRADAVLGEGEVTNVALAATVHQRRGQVFIVLLEESEPPLVIHNNLDIPVRYGQAFKNLREFKTLNEYFY